MANLLIILAIGFLIALMLSALFRDRTPRDNFWFFLLIVFLVTWAGGLWLISFDPNIFNIALLSYLFAGLFFTILLAAAAPRNPSKPQRVRIEEVQRSEPSDSALEGLTFFLWIAMILTFTAIIVVYLLLPIS